MDRLDEGVDGVYDLSTSASADLTQINTALNHSCNLLNTAAEKSAIRQEKSEKCSKAVISHN